MAYRWIAWVAAASLVALAGLAAGREDPHAFMKVASECGKCHPGSPARLERIPAESDEYCSSCHKRPKDSHPLEVPSDLACPPDFLIDGQGRIGCLTCHCAHGAWESNRPWTSTSVAGGLGRLLNHQKNYKTYYLRRNNVRGELCLTCHDNY